MMFLVEDVVEEGDGGAESFVEILTRELGEIAQGAESPELGDLWDGGVPFQVGEMPGETEREPVEHFLWNMGGG